MTMRATRELSKVCSSWRGSCATGGVLMRLECSRSPYRPRRTMAFLAPRSHPSAQRRAKQREQTLPMPLSGGSVVCRPLRESEAVVGAGVDFHLGVAAVSVEFEAQPVDHLRRRVLIGFGAAEI